MTYFNKYKVLIICVLLIIITIIGTYFIGQRDTVPETGSGSSFLKDLNDNEVQKVYVTEEDMARNYLASYVNLMVNDSEKAYDLIDKDCQKFGSYEDFVYYIKNLMTTKFISAKMTKYKVNTKNKIKYFVVKDNDNNEFTFKENSIMNYSVII